MSTQAGALKEFALQAQARRKETDDLCAVQAIASLDPHMRSDFANCIAALNEAQADRDDEAAWIALKAMREIFQQHQPEQDVTLDEWECESGERDPSYATARQAQHALNRDFFAKYEQAKHDKGFTTQRQVADACGLAVNTIAAIEGKRVKPQSATLQKLAEGLGIELQHLLGDEVL